MDNKNVSSHWIVKHFLSYCLPLCLLSSVSLNSLAASNAITPATLPSNTPAAIYNTPGPSIAANPAASNVLTGTGEAQTYIEKMLGIHNNHGIRIGGVLLGDANDLFSGGIPGAKTWTFNGLLLLGMTVETEKLIGWEGGLFDVEFLQFNGQSTNKQAGTVQGYNSLPGSPPLNRSE